jgi:hypothetical protein
MADGGAGLVTPAKKNGLPRWLKVAVIAIAVIVILVLIIVAIPLPLEGSVQPDYRNEQVYAALAANGITDAAVDITASHVLVSAIVPDAADAPKVKYIVWGAVSQLADPPPLIIVEVFMKDGKALGTTQVPVSAVTDYTAGKISLDNLEKAAR